MFRCTIYENAFTRKDNLDRHKQIHEKSCIQCEFCAKIFIRKDNLFKHIQRVHSEYSSKKNDEEHSKSKAD